MQHEETVDPKDCQYYSENNQHVFLLPRTEISVRFLCGPGCPDLSPDRVAVCDRSSHPLLSDHLLLAPNVRKHCWRWLSPGGAVGIIFWLLASLGLRLYLHFFNVYSFTYGSLGAVIILLMWFYITGFMILLGAEINSEIEAAAAEIRLTTTFPTNSVTTPPIRHPEPGQASIFH